MEVVNIWSGDYKRLQIGALICTHSLARVQNHYILLIAGEPDLGIFKIRHRMNPALHPRYLSNLTLGLVNHFNELINHYHPDLEGILAGFGKIFLHRPNGHFLNEEAHIHLDVTADFWVFRPSVGAQGCIQIVSQHGNVFDRIIIIM